MSTYLIKICIPIERMKNHLLWMECIATYNLVSHVLGTIGWPVDNSRVIISFHAKVQVQVQDVN